MLSDLWALRRWLPPALSIRALHRRPALAHRISAELHAVADGDSRRLELFGYKDFSQGDEDGVIAEIFRRIGICHRTFVEFGAGDGMENNTRRLLGHGWEGLWIEAVPERARAIRRRFRSFMARGYLRFIEAAVTAENIDDLLRAARVAGEIDFLSIDIDGNDYHVFAAITAIEPRVVCLEYNIAKPPPLDWVMPYDPAHRWREGSDHYGASLVALDRLAHDKGYTLVGTALYSVNAFFVRSDLAQQRFSGPFTPARFFHHIGHERIAAVPRRSVRERLYGTTTP